MYTYAYITNDGEIHENEGATMKAKGIPSKCLNHEYYADDKPHEVEFESLKKKHKNLTHADEQAGIKHFSIVNTEQTRTFNASSWKGFDFDEATGEWYPRNYQK
jgi:hypothetical protein